MREDKGSNIFAGLDPAPYELGRGESGLPAAADLREWSFAFIKAVAPYVAGVKMNQAFFQDVDQRAVLCELVAVAKGEGLLVMSDNKIADIGNTNDTWIYYNTALGFDCTTCAPYAGNIESTIKDAHNRDIAMIPMGLMSNPEYKTEMSYIHPETGESLWKSRVRRSLEAGADGIVVGGTYTKDDPEFVEFVAMTNDSDVLYLIPGIGAQGGSVESFLASGIDPKRCMINSGRAVMFPSGSDSIPEEQAAAAQELRDNFNKIVYHE